MRNIITLLFIYGSSNAFSEELDTKNFNPYVACTAVMEHVPYSETYTDSFLKFFQEDGNRKLEFDIQLARFRAFFAKAYSEAEDTSTDSDRTKNALNDLQNKCRQLYSQQISNRKKQEVAANPVTDQKFNKYVSNIKTAINEENYLIYCTEGKGLHDYIISLPKEKQMIDEIKNYKEMLESSEFNFGCSMFLGVFCKPFNNARNACAVAGDYKQCMEIKLNLSSKNNLSALTNTCVE